MAIKNIMTYLAAHPSEAPTCWLMLSSGKFKEEAKKWEQDRIPHSYEKVGDLSQDAMKDVCTGLVPSLSPMVWARLQKARYADGNMDRALVKKVFMYLTGDKDDDPLVCHSKSLLVKLYEQKRTGMGALQLLMDAEFCVNWRVNGVYSLSDPITDGGLGRRWTKVKHSCGQSVDLPKTTIFLVDKVYIESNWSEKGAYIADSDDDVHKVIYPMFQKVGLLKWASVRALAKTDQFSKAVAESEQLDDGSEKAAPPPGAAASSSAANPSAAATPTPAKKKLKRSLSDVVVPAELLSGQKSKQAQAPAKPSTT